MTDKFANLEAELAALRADYLQTLPARLAEMREMVDALATARPPAPLDRLDALRIHAHKLAGLAPIHGLDEIGAVAVAIQDICDDCHGGGRGPTPDQLTSLGALIDSLADHIRVAVPD